MVVSRSTSGVGAPEMAGFDVSAASVKIGNNGRVVFSATPASLAKVVDGKTYSSRDVDAGSLIADFAEDGNGSGKKADDWRHVVFAFTNKQGVNRSFVLNLATDPVFKDGQIKYKGKVDLDKTETRMLEGMPGGKKYLVEGDYEIPKARLIFSSFEDDDLKRARKYNRRFGDPSKTASLSLKLLDSGGNQIASKDQSGRLGPLVPVLKNPQIDTQIDSGLSSTRLTFGVSPDFAFSVTTPDPKWYQAYQYLDPTRYSANLDAGLTWDLNVDFDAGAQSGGEIKLSRFNIDGPEIPLFPAGTYGISAQLASGVDLGLDVVADGPGSSVFGASQRFGFNLKAGSNGVAFKNTSTGINWLKPSLDVLTGFEVVVAPFIQLQLALGVSIPFFGGDVNLLEAGPKVSLPINIRLGGIDGLGDGAAVTAGFAAELGFEAALFPFLIGGGITYESPAFTFIPRQDFVIA